MLRDIIENNNLKDKQIIKILDFNAFDSYFSNKQKAQNIEDIELMIFKLEDLNNSPIKDEILDLEIECAYWERETKNLIVQAKITKKQKEKFKEYIKQIIQTQPLCCFERKEKDD